MLTFWNEMWQTAFKALEKQQAEVPDFFAPYWVQAQRLFLPALVMFTAAAAILFAWALLQFAVNRKRPKILCQRAFVLFVCGVLCSQVFAPLPVAAQADYTLEVRTRVPGKAEKVMVLNKEQEAQVKELLKEATVTRGWETELPYAGYGQTFRIFIGEGETQQCLYLSPEQGCLYSNFDKALIYSVNSYQKLYDAIAQATQGAGQVKAA